MVRSIKQAVEYIRKTDPESAIKVHTIRTWCKENKIKNLRAGTKILVDVESLLNYISNK